MKIEGLEAVMASLRRLGKAGERAAKAVLKEKTQEIVKLARPETPIEEDGGALRDSERTTRPTMTRSGQISAGVVAGGAPLRGTAELAGRKANVYAVVQHEDLTLKHTTGGPKFLERPFLQVAPTVPDALMDAMDKETS